MVTRRWFSLFLNYFSLLSCCVCLASLLHWTAIFYFGDTQDTITEVKVKFEYVMNRKNFQKSIHRLLIIGLNSFLVVGWGLALAFPALEVRRGLKGKARGGSFLLLELSWCSQISVLWSHKKGPHSPFSRSPSPSALFAYCRFAWPLTKQRLYLLQVWTEEKTKTNDTFLLFFSFKASSL